MACEPSLEASVLVDGAAHARPRVDITLRAGPGVTLLWGPSGAGKSSCLLALAGLLRPKQGRIVLDGRILFDAQRKICVPTRERGVGLVFQSLALFPHLSVAENVSFGVSSRNRTEREAEVHHWMLRMRVSHLRERRALTLSGGEAQRVALARVLASRPRLLLLDEPFSALDQALRDELSDELTRVVGELGVPALMVSHHAEDRLRWPGRVVRVGDPGVPLSHSAQALVANPTISFRRPV